MLCFIDEVLKPLSHCLKQWHNQNAFCIAGCFYTYEQLADRITRIRELIRTINSCDKIYGLVIYDDIATYATIISLWLEGKAYVPLNPLHPCERNERICRKVNVNILFDSKEKLFINGVKTFGTDTLPSSTNIIHEWDEVGDEELAYILFTSGSTGEPKGVQISRRNVASFMNSFWKTGISISERDHCLQCFDLTFDVSIQSFLVALTRGACLYTLPYGQIKYLNVASLFLKYPITFGAMAPSMLNYLRPYFNQLYVPTMRACILTAEACPAKLMEEWFSCVPNAVLYDFYGPTEATVYCTCYQLKREENKTLNGIISIGKPLANVTAYIMDEDHNVMPRNTKGELCVAGPQVTAGYWDNLEKNSASFFTKSIDGQDMRFYHTGDLCYMDDEGDIMYSGRIDQQAKIQGFRVELGEIEFYAREFYGSTKRVVAMANTNDMNITEIVLFVESSSEGSSDLDNYLRQKMPSYMIPNEVIYLPVFPINNSDKIDRVQLKKYINNQ